MISNMRVLYTLNSGQPGGMERHVLDLVTGMVSRGHQVFVWCNEGPITKWYTQAGAEVTVASCVDLDPRYIFALYKFLKLHKVDVIHGHELKVYANAQLAATLAGTKAKVFHIHTPFSEWPISDFRKKLYSFFYPRTLRRFNAVEIALTDSRKRVKMQTGIDEARLVVIPNAVDLERFTFSTQTRADYKKEIQKKYKLPAKFTFGLISRMTEEKGHKVLLEAFYRFLDYKEVERENVHLLLAGGGELEKLIKAQIAELGLTKHVTLTGRFDDSELVKLYVALDAFVFPSFAEGFGIVLIEAMASGLPIISSNLEVLEEVGGSTMFAYFDVGNAQNLAEKMHNLYSKKDVLSTVGESARQRVQALYTLDKFTDAYESLYTKLLEAAQ